MGDDRPDHCALVNDALAALDAARVVLTGLSTALEKGLQGSVKPTDWQASQRPGTPARIEFDPDLRALILDRIDRLTFDQVRDAVRAVLTGLSTALEGVVKGPVQMDGWRASHRPGTPSRIESDPELRAFILARIDRLTFDQVITEVAANFPPERRTSRSALHRWWHRHGKRA